MTSCPALFIDGTHMNDLHDLRDQRLCCCGDLADEHELGGGCAVEDCECPRFRVEWHAYQNEEVE